MPESPAERAARLLNDADRYAAVYDDTTTLGPLVWQPLARDVLALSEQLEAALIDANALDLIHRDTAAKLAEARKREDVLHKLLWRHREMVVGALPFAYDITDTERAAVLAALTEDTEDPA